MSEQKNTIIGNCYKYKHDKKSFCYFRIKNEIEQGVFLHDCFVLDEDDIRLKTEKSIKLDIPGIKDMQISFEEYEKALEEIRIIVSKLWEVKREVLTEKKHD